MKTVQRIVLLLCCAGMIAVAGPAGAFEGFAGTSGEIRISGGTAHIPVLKKIAETIMKDNPGISISIAGGGSGLGIKEVGEGLVDIGNSGRTPKDEEIAKYGLVLHRWAIDGVCAVVSPSNPVKALDARQLAGIFTGAIDNWNQVGGPDKAINIYTRDESSGTREVFWEKALAKGDISKKAVFVASNGAMKTAVSNDPYGIGYISVGFIDNSVAPVTLDGNAPTLDNVKSGKYTVARGLYSNTRGEPKGIVKSFIACLYTAEGQKIIAEEGFIPVNK